MINKKVIDFTNFIFRIQIFEDDVTPEQVHVILLNLLLIYGNILDTGTSMLTCSNLIA